MFARGAIRRTLKRWKSWLLRDAHALIRHNSQLMGRMASWQVRSQMVLSSLQDAEFKVSSQSGEDGIIDWLVERADYPAGFRL